jgi:arylsulfatase A-like enzyme
VEAAFTESVDVMPTILAALGGEIPRASDGQDLLPLVHRGQPEGWRRFAFTEYDFRDVFYSKPETSLGLPMDDCALCAIQDERYKYVHFSGLPPLFFDLERDPHMFENLAERPEHAALVRDWAQNMLSHRMRHAERTLTHFRATPGGLEERTPLPRPALPIAAQ